MTTFTLTKASTLEQFNSFVHSKDVPDGSKLRARVNAEGHFEVYVSSKGKGTGLKNFLFGTVDQRRANVILALKVLASRANAPALSQGSHAWLTDRNSATSDLTKANFTEKLALKDPLSAMRRQVDTWREENDTHRQKIEKAANDIRQIGTELDAVDTTHKLSGMRGRLEEAIARLREAEHNHSMWYLQGKGSTTSAAPRDGLDPLLKNANLTKMKFAGIDGKQGLESVLHTISQNASEVKDLRKESEDLYADLELRLDIRETQLTETPDLAKKKTVELLEARLASLKDLTSHLKTELKADKTRNLMAQLRDKDSTRSEQLQKQPDLVKVEIQSNDLRLGRIPVFIKRIDSAVARLKAAVPESMRDDPRMVKLLGEVDECARQHHHAMSEDEAVLRECNQLIEEKLANRAA